MIGGDMIGGDMIGGAVGRADNLASRTGAAAEQRVLEALRQRLLRRDPQWALVGPEDGRTALLEVFAEALGELQAAVDGLDETLLPRLLEELGDEPGWPLAARGAVVFRPRGGAAPARIPAGTVVVASRAAGDPAVPFETTAAAWCGDSQLERVVSTAADAHREWLVWPEAGWDGEVRELWPDGRALPRRFLYFGDAALALLRAPDTELLLEWPEGAEVLAEAEWEISALGGWRRIAGSWEEAASRAGERRLALRLRGPIPDLAEVEVDCLEGLWLRCRLPVRAVEAGRLLAPWWAGALGPAPSPAGDRGGGVLSFPRPLARILSRDEERWRDHTGGGSARAIELARAADGSPALWLGWSRAESASVHFELERDAVPGGRWRVGDTSRPVLRWEYSTAGGFRALDVDDGTLGLSASGTVTWEAAPDWRAVDLHGSELCWLRARWIDGGYERPPRLRAVLPHAVSVRQGRTVEGRTVEASFDARGVARIDDQFDDGTPESVAEVEVEDDAGGWTRIAVADHGAARGAVVRRHPRGGLVVDAGASWRGPRVVRFPRLRLVRGRRGDLPAGSVDAVEPALRGVGAVEQPLPTAGGADPESAEAFRRRVSSLRRTGDRIVTAADLREAVASLEPAASRVVIANLPAASGRVLVTIVVGSPGGRRRLGAERLGWIEAELAERLPLGIVVEVTEASWFPVEVVVRSERPESLAGGRARLLERLRRFFDPWRGGADGKGLAAAGWLDGLDLASAVLAGDDGGISGVLELRPGGPTRGAALPLSWSRSEAVEGAVFPVLEGVVFERGRGDSGATA